MEIENSVFGLITESNADTLLKIWGILKLDGNPVAEKNGKKVLYSNVLNPSRSRTQEDKLWERCLWANFRIPIIPQIKSVKKEKLPTVPPQGKLQWFP